MSSYEIVMDRPGLNALGLETMDWLLAELELAGTRPLLLTGTGRAFSAGVNLKEVAGLDRNGLRTFLERLDLLVERLYTHPAPTVAAVNGHAIAGGCVLAVVCDRRVMTTDERARMGLNEVSIGVEYPPVTLSILARRLPVRSLETVLLGAQLHAPPQALELGLVDVLSDDCVAAARSELEQLSAAPGPAYAAAKAALHRNAAAAREGADLEGILDAWCSDETRARIQAVLGG